MNLSKVNENKTRVFLQDLKKILDDTKEGFIYFSLGSNIKSSFLSAERLAMFLETFKKLPYIVLWKYESDLLDQPNNVITREWLPQHAVLGLFSSRDNFIQNIVYMIEELDFFDNSFAFSNIKKINLQK